MTSLGNRPRLFRRLGSWWCQSTDGARSAYGVGQNMLQAYENWKRTEKYAFPKQRPERSA